MIGRSCAEDNADYLLHGRIGLNPTPNSCCGQCKKCSENCSNLHNEHTKECENCCYYTISCGWLEQHSDQN